MLSKELEEVLQKWRIKEATFERDIEQKILPWISSSHVVFLYGPRRSGKSVVARRLLEKMPKDTVTRYVNFEDPKLAGLLGTDLLDSLADGLGAKDTLVLDEVQLVNGWEKWVRKSVDTKQCRLIVTGSSAKLLSSEFASALGGRGIGFQVLPFSFNEFKRITKKDFGDYLKIGGYPEVALNPEKKEKLLESYFELALIKDIIGRYAVRDSAGLRNLAFFLLTNSGKQVSLKKIRAALGLSYDTIRLFLEYLEASFLVFQVPFFSFSLADSLSRPRKIFAFDVGMQQYASKSFTEDLGWLAETAVAIELKRREFETYYWKNSSEVDFIAKKKTSLLPLNVCYDSRPAEREKKGLLEFCKKYRLKKAILVCNGKTHTGIEQGIEIEKKNLLEWLAGE